MEPDWKVQEQFILDKIQHVFALDCLESSHPISIPVGHPNEISQIFDGISYDKGKYMQQSERYTIKYGVYLCPVRCSVVCSVEYLLYTRLHINDQDLDICGSLLYRNALMCIVVCVLFSRMSLVPSLHRVVHHPYDELLSDRGLLKEGPQQLP